MDNFDDYCVNIDTDCLHQDIDDIDLYAKKLVEDEDDGFGDEISFE